eukprot:4487457-Prymnesium_polylepis.1
MATTATPAATATGTASAATASARRLAPAAAATAVGAAADEVTGVKSLIEWGMPCNRDCHRETPPRASD